MYSDAYLYSQGAPGGGGETGSKPLYGTNKKEPTESPDLQAE